MARVFILTAFLGLFCVSFTGCGISGEAEFTPSALPTAEEEAETKAYEESMQKAAQSQKGGYDPNGGDPFAQ